MSVSDVSFIALDQGPGAFTSLRVLIATVNAFGFNNTIPLIGIDGLDALAEETVRSDQMVGKSNFSHIITLLNAYNNDVYVGMYQITKKNNDYSLESVTPNTYKKIDTLLEELKNDTFKQLIFTGNGAELHQELIKKELKEKAVLSKPLLQTCSALQIGEMAFKLWKKQKKISYKIQPLYLKSLLYSARK